MPQRLGKYLLLERINQGGMAFVYLAKTFGWGGADQVFALKCIRPDFDADPMVDMFIDEAKLSVQLSHANIAKTFELGRIDTTYFIAMEHVLGRDLRAVIDRAKTRDGGIPTAITLLIIAHMLDGLDYAHRKTDLTGMPLHIVHRDVSPQNALVSYAGEVKLIDFGIAKAASHSAQQQAGVLRGKYGYMSPEQVRAQAVDARSDIFATGVLLFEMITSTRLFPGTSDFSILEKVRYGEVYPPSFIVPGLPADVEAIVLKALAREPEDRFASASDMRDVVLQAMLRHYGHPTQRDLAAWMHVLFEDERRADLALLDRTAQITAMPAEAPPYTSHESTRIHVAPAPAPAPADDAGDVERTLVSRSFMPEGPSGASDTRIVAAPVASAPSEPELVDDIDVELQESREREPDTAVVQVVGRRAFRLEDAAPVRGSDDHDDGTDRVQRDELAAAAREPKGDERTTRVKRSTFSDDTDIGNPIRALEGPYIAPDGRGTVDSTPPSGVVAYSGRGALRDALIIVASFMIGGSIVAGTWYATRGASTGYGGIVVRSEPSGADVLIDGAHVGVTPFTSTRVLAGKRSVVVRRVGNSEARETVTVEADEVATVEMQLGRQAR